MLIQIAKKPSVIPVSLVDKFFLLGAICGFIGSAYLGSYLWLMRSAELPLATSYIMLRNLHALVQLYLFLGLFILGFTFHALPRLMQTDIHASKHFLLILLLPVLSLALFIAMPDRTAYSWPLFLAFAVAFLFVANLARHASLTNAILFAPAMLLGLLTLGIGAGTDLGNLHSVLIVFWLGIGSIIFATGQQFISAFLGGQRLSILNSILLLALIIISGWNAWIGEYRLFGLFSLITSSFYIAHSRAYLGIFKLLSPISFAFISAQIWLILGSINLIFDQSSLDYTIHLWSTGWAITLVIGTSSQIISFLSQKPLLPPLPLLLVIILWQLVPIGRGLGDLTSLPAWSSWLVALSALLVFSVWGGRLIFCASTVIRSQIKNLSATQD